MTYSTRNNITEQQHDKANKPTATAQFVDGRASASLQLKQQLLMASSPKVTMQRAAINTMNTSAVQQQKIIQCAALEEELQMEAIAQTAQLAGMEDEELLQGKFETSQRVENEELVQGKFESVQRAEKPNNTGLPNQLKAGIENLSGMNMDHVKVHYNSSQPAQLNAHAYAQGSDIHVAPGQEKHLPHEAWHVVQQAQGRVKPTMQMKGNVPVNDDVGLESEADVMGAKALKMSPGIPAQKFPMELAAASGALSTAQLTLKPAKVVSTLKTILVLHGLEATYNTWWGDKTIKRISEEIGAREETDETNVSSLVRGHPDVADLLKAYRKDMSVGTVADGSAGGQAAEDAEVINAFRDMVFFHGSKFAASIRENGLDPSKGGSEEGASAERSINALVKAKNLAGAKGFVFVTRSYDEAKQYGNGSAGVVYLIVPPELKNNLVLDVDSQLGMKGKDHLKGAVRTDKSLNWWGMQYLITYLKQKYTKAELEIIWTRVKDECVK